MSNRLTRICLSLLSLTALSPAISAPRSSVVGTITHCTESKYIGKTIGFLGLDSENPKYLWPSGHQINAIKLFSDERMTVLAFSSKSNGSTENVYFDWPNKVFTVISVSLFARSLIAAAPVPPIEATTCRGFLG